MGLHCKHLPTSTVVHGFKQRTMSGANGAFDALGMGPSIGYTLNSDYRTLRTYCIDRYVILHVVASFVSDIHIHIYVVTNLLMFYFWIKLTMKMPNYLTTHVTKFGKKMTCEMGC
jgi:hypothetical protein